MKLKIFLELDKLFDIYNTKTQHNDGFWIFYKLLKKIKGILKKHNVN